MVFQLHILFFSLLVSHVSSDGPLLDPVLLTTWLRITQGPLLSYSFRQIIQSSNFNTFLTLSCISWVTEHFYVAVPMSSHYNYSQSINFSQHDNPSTIFSYFLSRKSKLWRHFYFACLIRPFPSSGNSCYTLFLDLPFCIQYHTPGSVLDSVFSFPIFCLHRSYVRPLKWSPLNAITKALVVQIFFPH